MVILRPLTLKKLSVLTLSLQSRMHSDWKEYRVARRHAQLVYEETEQAFTELDDCAKSMEVMVYS